MGTALLTTTTLPPDDAPTVESVRRLARALEQPTAQLVAPDGTAVDVPPQVHDVLVRVVEAMQAGRAITIAPMEQRLTTSQAADFLGVSRPTVVKLLEEGRIPYEKVTRHRRVRLDDLLAFRDQRRTERRSLLDDMTRQGVADGLYAAAADDYTAALRRARTGVVDSEGGGDGGAQA